MIDELDKLAREEEEARKEVRFHLNVCNAAGCASAGGDRVVEELRAEIDRRDLGATCKARGVGCMGLCCEGPLVEVEEDGVLYQKVTPQKASDIIDSLGKAPVKELVADTSMPFFARQKKIVLENSGRIDPERLEDYVVQGGYRTLISTVTERSPHDVIAEIQTSGLRGRGGGGYPVGLKWATVQKAKGAPKYVVCNADEGDPGAFMDRSVLESDPHRVLEGMTLAAYAIGASRGYIYVRAEYPLAIARLRKAIKQAKRLGVLGDQIGGTEFSFFIEIRLGAGAFVCGEETALIASIEGKRGSPRPRPPYPAEVGLWGQPTLINNVETFANIVPILREGGEWYSAIGTEKSKGTKVFALAGKIRNTGLIEVPMGIPLREIIEEIGGGVPDGGELKAVQTGGPSGGCVPTEHLDTPVDYESLSKLGAIMGSGGMIVMDETSCMVDVAKFFMDFCKSESCGKCIPCRAGTVQVHGLLEKICGGEATTEDLGLLEELCDLVKNTSLCGLGQSAPNPVLSTLKYFHDEYLAHVVDKSCPADACAPLASTESGCGAT